MVQMQPGSAKSTYGSILFPAYFLALHKNKQIIATAHTASLADYFARHVRNTFVEYTYFLGIKISAESCASARIFLQEDGECFAAGVRGPITGRRADSVIIGDPVKSWAEAESQTFRDALYDWYRAELSARLKPGGRIVLIMTRWHEDDLAGRLWLAQATLQRRPCSSSFCRCQSCHRHRHRLSAFARRANRWTRLLVATNGANRAIIVHNDQTDFPAEYFALFALSLQGEGGLVRFKKT
jgi:hypothetical protein